MISMIDMKFERKNDELIVTLTRAEQMIISEAVAHGLDADVEAIVCCLDDADIEVETVTKVAEEFIMYVRHK